jgi:hypothetical protein
VLLRYPSAVLLELVEIFKAARFRRCFYCGCRVYRLQHVEGEPSPPNQLTLDHMIPKSRGGAKDCELNVVTTCYACNTEKGKMTVEEYRAMRGYGDFWGEIAAKKILAAATLGCHQRQDATQDEEAPVA